MMTTIFLIDETFRFSSLLTLPHILGSNLSILILLPNCARARFDHRDYMTTPPYYIF